MTDQLVSTPTGEAVFIPGFVLVLALTRLPGERERWAISPDRTAGPWPPGLDALPEHVQVLLEYEAPTLADAREAAAAALPLLRRAARQVHEAREECWAGLAGLRQAVEEQRAKDAPRLDNGT